MAAPTLPMTGSPDRPTGARAAQAEHSAHGPAARRQAQGQGRGQRPTNQPMRPRQTGQRWTSAAHAIHRRQLCEEAPEFFPIRSEIHKHYL